MRFRGGQYDEAGPMLTQRFAAFARRSLVYDGHIQLEYQLLPPYNLVEQSPKQVPYRTNSTPGTYLPLPVDAVRDHLRHLGTSPPSRQEIIDGFKDNNPLIGTTDAPAVFVEVQTLARSTVMQLPSWTLMTQVADPVSHSAMVKMLLAVQDGRPHPKHPHGFLCGDGFKFRPKSATRIKELVTSAEQPAGVATPKPPRARGAVTSPDATPASSPTEKRSNGRR